MKKFIVCSILFSLLTLFLMSGVSAQEKKVAVLPFNNGSNVYNWWSSYSWGGSFDPGSVITAALTTKLVNSNQYLVLDRENIDLILKEQNLGQSGLVSPETAVEVGRLLGARYIITGTVTEFAKVSSGDRGRISLPVSGRLLGLGGKTRDVVRVACEVKVTDVETGLISSAMSSRKEISTGSGGLSGFYRGYDFSGRGGELPSSGLGKGLYEVANDLASQIENAKFKDVAVKPKLKGYILDVDGDKVFINLTSRDGLYKNSIFKVSRERNITDPKTKRVTVTEKTIGEIKVINVGDSSSECQIIEGHGFQPEDSVRQR